MPSVARTGFDRFILMLMNQCKSPYNTSTHAHVLTVLTWEQTVVYRRSKNIFRLIVQFGARVPVKFNRVRYCRWVPVTHLDDYIYVTID
jgi:hypothetical protein